MILLYVTAITNAFLRPPAPAQVLSTTSLLTCVFNQELILL
jgi:hypothetical protein